MSQAEQQTNQPNVRHIPIFVEGRDSPIVNRDLPDGPGMSGMRDSSPPPPPRMADFGAEIPMPKHGSIFDRAKDFPVRSGFPSSFFRGTSPTRAESPVRQVPVFHTTTQQRGPSPRPAEPVHQQTGRDSPQQQPRTVPIKVQRGPSPRPPQAAPEHQQQQRQASPKPEPVPARSTPPPQQQQTPPTAPPKPSKEDPITKIQKIQKDVLDLMDKVEKFQGKSKKDKEYLYLDEMLTQNLLKLDTVDTEGKDNIKLARKEAIRCINRCISVLEAKAMEGEKAATEQLMNNDSKPGEESPKPMEVDQQSQPSTVAEPQASTEKRDSIYDNHDTSAPQPTVDGDSQSGGDQSKTEQNATAPSPVEKEKTPPTANQQQTETTPAPSQ